MLRRIKFLLKKDVAAKVLVFSSWQDVLELLSHALQTNDLPFAYARGRKSFDSAVADFKKTAGADDCQKQRVQILLLLVKQGANGLNLTGGSPEYFASCRVLSEAQCDDAIYWQPANGSAASELNKPVVGDASYM